MFSFKRIIEDHATVQVHFLPHGLPCGNFQSLGLSLINLSRLCFQSYLVVLLSVGLQLPEPNIESAEGDVQSINVSISCDLTQLLNFSRSDVCFH